MKLGKETYKTARGVKIFYDVPNVRDIKRKKGVRKMKREK